jgi:ElaB/YqjD/DUF883 family membrane-anchored ribosome-binding protein
MAIADMIPQMNDADLASLHDNARRIEASSTGLKQEQASQLRPLIEAELVRRESAKPAKKTVAKPRAKKVVAKAAA